VNLAITLLVAAGIASIVGTVLKQNEAFQNHIIKFGPFRFEVLTHSGCTLFTARRGFCLS